MPLKNKSFDGWLDNLDVLLDKSYQNHGLFITKMGPRRLREKPRWYKFNTQRIRREVARGLGDLYDSALAFSQDASLDLKEREKWTRIAAYVVQIINTILNAYDEVEIETALHELKEYVKKHVEPT